VARGAAAGRPAGHLLPGDGDLDGRPGVRGGGRLPVGTRPAGRADAGLAAGLGRGVRPGHLRPGLHPPRQHPHAPARGRGRGVPAAVERRRRGPGRAGGNGLDRGAGNAGRVRVQPRLRQRAAAAGGGPRGGRPADPPGRAGGGLPGGGGPVGGGRPRAELRRRRRVEAAEHVPRVLPLPRQPVHRAEPDRLPPARAAGPTALRRRDDARQARVPEPQPAAAAGRRRGVDGRSAGGQFLTSPLAGEVGERSEPGGGELGDHRRRRPPPQGGG
jgi:hypothetical protein